MSTEIAKTYLESLQEKHDNPIKVLVEHGKQLGHEFSETELLEASGGGSINIFSNNKFKMEW
jgi:hypothetical protein